VIRLESERLVFRDHEPQDREPYCAMESDALYRAPQPVHPREELERRFLETWLPHKPMGLLATVLKADAQYIGRCGLYPFRTDDGMIVANEATLAFYLARSHWGRGLATEAGRSFIAHGFDQLGLTCIHAGVNTQNAASLRVLEKLGFSLVRTGEGGGNRWHDFELVNPRKD
jgi:[ribosomal protein S5]-alanine N-acetyltransferase